jgi:hypothetical protein
VVVTAGEEEKCEGTNIDYGVIASLLPESEKRSLRPL